MWIGLTQNKERKFVFFFSFIVLLLACFDENVYIMCYLFIFSYCLSPKKKEKRNYIKNHIWMDFNLILSQQFKGTCVDIWSGIPSLKTQLIMQ